MTTQLVASESAIELEGGKYTVIHSSTGKMEALRYGSPWRDLTGDKLLLAMFQEINDLKHAQQLAAADTTRFIEALLQERCGDASTDLDVVLKTMVREHGIRRGPQDELVPFEHQPTTIQVAMKFLEKNTTA